MTSPAAQTITALRREHDSLASIVATLTPEQLTGPSGASEWTVADVLSHLGSGAEISLAGLRAAAPGAEAPGPDFNQSVWDRWNAMSPQDQASGSVESNAALIAAFEAVPQDQHETLRVPTFLPEPVALRTFAGLRLSEVVPHSWDVRVGIDPAATLSEESAQLLAEHLTTDLGFLLGFIGKPAEGREAVVLDIAGTPYRVVLDDTAKLTTEALSATATFTGPIEAAARLLYGRLKPAYVPDGVEVSGNVTLDDLRTAFPGF